VIAFGRGSKRRHCTRSGNTQNIDHELNRVLDLTRVLTRLLELASERVPAEGASIWLLKPRTKILELTALSIDMAEDGAPRDPLPGYARDYALGGRDTKSARVANVHRDALVLDFYVQMMPGTLSSWMFYSR